MYVILVYDINQSEEGAKTWRRCYKICKQYLHHVQNSVFEGEISPAQLRALEYDLKVHLRDDLDSIIVYKTEQMKSIKRHFWAKQDDATDNFF